MADIFNMVDTWNDASTVFDGIKLDVVNTNSNFSSWLLRLLVGGANRYRFRNDGVSFFTNDLYIQNAAATANWAILNAIGQLQLISSGGMLFSSSGTNAGVSSDTGVVRAAAGVVGVRAGATGAASLSLGALTVATLPAASTAGSGALAYVTDANATTPRSAVAAGGANKVLVMSDATNWLIVA